MVRSTLIGAAFLAAIILAAGSGPLEAQNYSGIVAGPARSASGGLVAGPRGFMGSSPATRFGGATSVTRDGLGGLRVQTQRGPGRFVDDGTGGGRIYTPGGGTGRVIGGSRGSRFVFIPGGTRMILGEGTRNKEGFSITRKVQQ